MQTQEAKLVSAEGQINLMRLAPWPAKLLLAFARLAKASGTATGPRPTPVGVAAPLSAAMLVAGAATHLHGFCIADGEARF